MMTQRCKASKHPFSLDALRKMMTFGHSVWSSPFTVESNGGLEYCPKLFRVYNDLGNDDYIEYDFYGEHPVRARCYIEGIAQCPRSLEHPDTEGPWKLCTITIMMNMMDSKFDDLAKKKPEIESAAIEMVKECAAKFGYLLSISETIKFNYYRNRWDQFVTGGTAI